jgi:UDP-2,3-diacylglucosamine pyrophosphatase LpxH
MTILEQVKQSLKWKQSNYYCATKLGISVEKYKELKRQVKFPYSETVERPQFNKILEFKEDLDKGTAEIKGLSLTEPRTPEEIIELLKIDTTKWKLSSYWNKERHDGWFISAMVTAIKHEPKDVLAEVIANFKPQYLPIVDILINEKFDRDSVGIISTQDLHFGKEDNEDIVEHFKDAIEDLVHRAYMSHRLTKIIYVVGGDLLNMDTFSGTTTSGTPVDNFQRAQEAYTEAFDALYWSINYLKQFCIDLHVVYLPGNHDRLSSFHMAHALSKCFNSEDISFDVEYAERKVVMYGKNMFAFEHGDVSKKNTALVYATEFPIEWGMATYRTCYTGHFHSKKTTEFITENEHNGFSIKHLPSLCSTDYWHYHNKYTGSKRQAIMEIHDVWKGKISEFVYTV